MYSIMGHLYTQKIRLQSKRFPTVNSIGGWVGLGTDLGVSQKRKSFENLVLL